MDPSCGTHPGLRVLLLRIRPFSVSNRRVPPPPSRRWTNEKIGTGRARAEELLPPDRAARSVGVRTVARAACPHVPRKNRGRVGCHGIRETNRQAPRPCVLPSVACESCLLHYAVDRIEGAVALR